MHHFYYDNIQPLKPQTVHSLTRCFAQQRFPSPHTMIPTGYMYFLYASFMSPTRLEALSLLFLCLTLPPKKKSIPRLFYFCMFSVLHYLANRIYNLHVNAPEGNLISFAVLGKVLDVQYLCSSRRERGEGGTGTGRFLFCFSIGPF